VINYRFGGLAEKILETHQIVLADLKLGLDLKKSHVGFMCERWDLSRGFSWKLARHKKIG
jgi:hypothetical protein